MKDKLIGNLDDLDEPINIRVAFVVRILLVASLT